MERYDDHIRVEHLRRHLKPGMVDVRTAHGHLLAPLIDLVVEVYGRDLSTEDGPLDIHHHHFPEKESGNPFVLLAGRVPGEHSMLTFPVELVNTC